MSRLDKNSAWSLQFITHATPKYDHLAGAKLALDGGCRWIQLRMKEATIDELLQVGKQLRQLTHTYHATMILDDHVELVEELEADGVHLGLQDMPIAEARSLLGKDKIIGGTANTIEDIAQHYTSGADYIGCGPYRFTQTKKQLAPTLGLEGYRYILQQMATRQITLPLIAIGGIESKDLPLLKKIGIKGVAISGAILRAAQPSKETKHVIQLLKEES